MQLNTDINSLISLRTVTKTEIKTKRITLLEDKLSLKLYLHTDSSQQEYRRGASELGSDRIPPAETVDTSDLTEIRRRNGRTSLHMGARLCQQLVCLPT